MALALSDFDYDLPPDLIAQEPSEQRDGSRLLHLEKPSGNLRHLLFRDIVSLLNAGDLLVLNDTKVIPARIFGRRATGGKVEFLLIRKVEGNRWESLLNPSNRIREEETIVFDGGMSCEIRGRREHGKWVVEFAAGIEEYLRQFGAPPLPPYIKRGEGARLSDVERYQTVYAEKEGAIAAPTAGLHFTKPLLEMIEKSGVEIVSVTLHVGPGTFKPIKVDRIEDHRMDSEYYEIGEETARKIDAARKEKRRIIAVGTTSCRTIESYAASGERSGWSDLYIYPPRSFALTGGLITNFHLPKSTLLLLVCAFAGREKIFVAYKEAIRRRYRFYSYGDAMFIA